MSNSYLLIHKARRLLVQSEIEVRRLLPHARFESLPRVKVLTDALAIKDAVELAAAVSAQIEVYYYGRMTRAQFVERMTVYVETQLIEGWLEGMRANGYTEGDLEEHPDWLDVMGSFIDSEKTHIPGLADWIEAEYKAGTNVDDLIPRGQLWGRRYDDIVNLAKVTTSEPTDKLIWLYDPDKEHCETCAALNGIVASAAEWEQAGVRPQNPPNDHLTCGGWQCGCVLDPTDKRRSPNALERILSAIGGG